MKTSVSIYSFLDIADVKINRYKCRQIFIFIDTAIQTCGLKLNIVENNCQKVQQGLKTRYFRGKCYLL